MSLARRTSLVAILAAIATALTACGDGDPQPAQQPAAVGDHERSVWEQAVADIDDDGTYSKDAALLLFAVAFGDMPGVDTPPGPPGDIHSGTMALHAVLAHETELTQAQRQRVADVRAVPDGSYGPPIQLIAYEQAPLPHASEEVQNLIEATGRQLRQDISARIGDDLPVPITIVFDARPYVAETRALGMADARYTGGRYSECVVHLFPATFTSGESAVTTLAHEMVHCFQYNVYPTLDALMAAPKWVVEGSAEWAGNTLAPQAEANAWWEDYLTQPQQDLRHRTYDAIGFYAHLDESGRSPWTVFRAMWSASGSQAAFAASGAAEGEFLDTWSASLARTPALGGAWDTTGPNITDDHAPQIDLTVPQGESVAVSAAPYANRLYALDVAADIVTLGISGHGRLGDGSVDDAELGSSTYCTRTLGCACPNGGPPEPPRLTRSGALLALTGGPEGTVGAVAGASLDDYCTPTGSGASWHLDSPSNYSAGPSHVIVDAYTCDSWRGPWHGTLHVTHGPAGAGDPPLDATVEIGWTFDRDGDAEVTIGPYEDTVFGVTHSITYYPSIHLDESAGTIRVDRLEGSEDGSPRIDVTSQLERSGEAIPLDPTSPPEC